MEQTVIKVGNSLGIIIPSHIIKSLNLKAGQKLYLDLYEREKTLTLKVNKNKAKGITPEFINFLDEFQREHSYALSKLAEK